MRGGGQGFILMMESLDTRGENLSNLERVPNKQIITKRLFPRMFLKKLTVHG